MTDRLRETVAYIRTYQAARAAPAGRDGAWREQAVAEARQWRDLPGSIGAADAATMANRGWTPAAVRPRLEAAYEEGDESDVDTVINGLLYGPGPDEDDPTV